MGKKYAVLRGELQRNINNSDTKLYLLMHRGLSDSTGKYHASQNVKTPIITAKSRLPDLLKVFGHWVQAKGRCSECVTICRPSLLDVANVFGQCGQRCGFSPV